MGIPRGIGLTSATRWTICKLSKGTSSDGTTSAARIETYEGRELIQHQHDRHAD